MNKRRNGGHVTFTGRTLPHNAEHERALLGGLLQEVTELPSLSVGVDDFYVPRNRAFFALLLEKFAAGTFRGPDALPVMLDAVAEHKDPEQYGGLGYVAGLPNWCPSTENLGFYAERIRALAVRRRLILASQKIATAALAGDEALATLTATAAADLAAALETAPLPTPVAQWVKPGTDPHATFLSDPVVARPYLVRTGIDDTAPGFLPRGEVGILAAPGGCGKTFVLLSLALAVAEGRRHWFSGPNGTLYTGDPGRVALLLAEDDTPEIQRRLQAQMRLTLPGVHPRRLDHMLWILPRDAFQGLDPALVAEKPSPTGYGRTGKYEPSALARKLTQDLHANGPWALVILDPLSAFAPPEAETDNAVATATMRELEALTKVPGNPTVLISHHTRKPKKNEDTHELSVDDVRGASGLVNRSRWTMVGTPKESSEREGAGFSGWKLVKSNYGRTGLTLTLVIGPGGAVRMATDTEITTLTPAPSPPPQASPKPNRTIR